MTFDKWLISEGYQSKNILICLGMSDEEIQDLYLDY